MWYIITKNSGMEDSILVLFLLVFCVCGIQTAEGQECSALNTTSLGDVNSNEFTGQVKFCWKGDWGAVCASYSYFGVQAAEVVCYELGYLGKGAINSTGPNTVTDGIVWLGKVECQGYEENLTNCKKKILDTTDIPQECRNPHPLRIAYVTCPKESQVRLHNYEEGKVQDYRGVVEHWYKGSWHVLCDTGEWTWNESQVVCWQLGLGEAVKPNYKYEGSIGSLDYFQNNIYCQSNEKMIKKCRIEQHWNTLSTCNGTVVNVTCKGPKIQDIDIITTTSDSVTLSWERPPNFTTIVVTKFRVEYWPEGHKSQKRCIDQSSNFNNATLEFLKPDTTYEMVIVPVMGEHPGPDSTTHRVKTRENPKITPDPVIVGLSCALAVSGIVIAILSGAIIRHFIRRRRHGYQNIPNGNGGQPVRVNGDVYFDARDGR